MLVPIIVEASNRFMPRSRIIDTSVKRGPNKKEITRLSADQQLFIEAVLADKDFSPSNACKTLGFKNPHQRAQRFINNPIVERALSRKIAERAWQFKLDSPRLIKELLSIGLFNPQEMFDANGEVIPIEKLPVHVARALHVEVSYIRDNETGEVHAKTHMRPLAKLESLHLLAKHIGMLDDHSTVDVEQTVKFDWASYMNGDKDVPDNLAKLIENPTSAAYHTGEIIDSPTPPNGLKEEPEEP